MTRTTLAPQLVVDEQEREAGLRRLIYEAAFSNAGAALTTGVILTAYALHLGANNFAIGLLAAIPFLAQLAQTPAILLVEKLRERKRIAVLSSIIGRSMMAIMALLPLAGSFALPLLVLTTLILCVMGAVGGCAWNAWMRDLAPENRMGDIFARRTVYGTFTTMIVGLAAALALELSTEGSSLRDLSFSGLYVAGCVAGLISAWVVARMPEPQMEPRYERSTLVDLLRAPLADPNFRQLILFLGSWQFAVNLATPFFTVFLVRQLGYSIPVVMGLSIASQIANVVALRNWGQLTDRFSNKSALMVAAPLYTLCIVAMIGASQIENPAGRLGWLIGLHLLMGGAVAGVTLATANVALKLSPRGEAAAYVAVSGIVTALAAGSAPILGGLFADFFARREFEIILRWTNPERMVDFSAIRLSNWDFYFILSGLLGVYALHRLGSVRETGEISRRQMVGHVVSMTRSSIHNFSTVTGLRAFTELPASLMREARVRSRFLRMQQSSSASRK
jgi:MFS family permease